jgi:putative hemolysin
MLRLSSQTAKRNQKELKGRVFLAVFYAKKIFFLHLPISKKNSLTVEDHTDYYIDVDKVIASKNPRLKKFLPKFIISYLKRIVHQDEINGVLRRHGHKQGLEFVNSTLKELGISYRVYGIENLKIDGRYLFASNHPLGGLDGLIMMSEMGRHYDNIKFVVNDLLLNIKQLEPLFIPVNKHGRQSADYAAKIEEAYSSDAQVLYFPAGLCSRKVKGSIVDLEWHKNFIQKAIKHQRDVVPVYFSGRNSEFFYNLSNLRSKVGIKVNFEFIYLVDEMFRQKDKKIDIVIGEPIPHSTFDKSKTLNEWASFVREKSYALAEQLDN